MQRRIPVFIFFFLLVFFVQLTGSLATEETTYIWYQTLNLPKWAPPSWVFAPVWTVLYIAIALSGYLFWRGRSSKNRRLTLTFWGLQLFFNGAWSFAFFYFMNPLLGAVDILLVIIFAFLTTYYGYKVNKFGFYLFGIYLLWLIFAASLNLGIVVLNS